MKLQNSITFGHHQTNSEELAVVHFNWVWFSLDSLLQRVKIKNKVKKMKIKCYHLLLGL